MASETAQFELLQRLSGANSSQEAGTILREQWDLVTLSFLQFFEDPVMMQTTYSLMRSADRFNGVRKLVSERYVCNLIEAFLHLYENEREPFFMEYKGELMSAFSFKFFQILLDEDDPRRKAYLTDCLNFIISNAVKVMFEEDRAIALQLIVNSPELFGSKLARDKYLQQINNDFEFKTRAFQTLQWLADISFHQLGGIVKDQDLARLMDEAADCKDQDEKVKYYRECLPMAANEEQSVKAMINFYLGSALAFSIRGEKSVALEAAMSHFNEAEKFFTKERSLYAWAKVQNGLATCYGYYQKNNAAENLEKAIILLEGTLQGFDQINSPQDWAMAQNNLGASYLERVKGAEQENIKKAIHYFEKALTIQTIEWVPKDWALSTTNLGLAYINRNSPDRIVLAEKAIKLFESVSKFYRKESNPYEWAKLQAHMGRAYDTLAIVAPATNREKALYHFQLATVVLTFETFPDEWAKTMVAMGNSFLERIKGEPVNNIESAISCFLNAFKVITANTQPYLWASTHQLMANAYRKRFRGNPKENQDLSIRHLESASVVLTQKNFPDDWARTEHLLGIILLKRIGTNESDNHEEAIRHFQNALKVRKPDKAPNSWAESMNSLAIAYMGRIAGDKADNMQQATHLLEEALSKINRTNNPEMWSILQATLATVNARDVAGDKKANRERAAELFKTVLEQNTPDSNPLECFKSAYKLGDLRYEDHQFADAIRAYDLCFRSAENIRAQSPQDITRRQLASDLASLFDKLVASCLELNEIEKALFYAAAGKARLFSDKLQNNPDLNNQNPAAKELLQSIGHLRDEIDNITSSNEYVSTGGKYINDNNLTLLSVVISKRKELGTKIEDLSYRFPDSVVNSPLITPQQIRELSPSPGSPIFLEFVRHEKGWGVFLVASGQVKYIALPDVKYESMEECFNFMTSYEHGVVSGGNPNIYTEELSNQLTKLYDSFLRPLEDLLPDGSKLVLAPAGESILLPLNIAFDKKNNKYLLEKYSLSFIPSLGAFYWLKQQDARVSSKTTEQKLLSVVYPGATASRKLKYAKPEADLVAGYFAAPPFSNMLGERSSTIKNTLEACNTALFDTIHFVCHGYFDFQYPDQSGFELNDGILTAERIQDEMILKNRPTVVLSACQSGQAMPAPGSESIGLVYSFFAAGAGTVIASQWCANDASTMELFKHYFELNQKMDKSESLRRAMLAVKQVSKWNHPIYWAAFTITGMAD